MKINELNKMCNDCIKLNKECEGTTEKVWTGCIYKERRGIDGDRERNTHN